MVMFGFFAWNASARPLPIDTLVSELSTRKDNFTLPFELAASPLPPQAARTRDATATPTTAATGRRLLISFIAFLHRRDIWNCWSDRRHGTPGGRHAAGSGEVGGSVSSVAGQGLLQCRVE